MVRRPDLLGPTHGLSRPRARPGPARIQERVLHDVRAQFPGPGYKRPRPGPSYVTGNMWAGYRRRGAVKRSIGPSEHHFPSQAEDAWAMLPRPPAAGRIGRAPKCHMGGCPLCRYQGMHAGREKRARGPGGRGEAGTRGGRGGHPKRRGGPGRGGGGGNPSLQEREGGAGGGIPRLQGALL